MSDGERDTALTGSLAAKVQELRTDAQAKRAEAAEQMAAELAAAVRTHDCCDAIRDALRRYEAWKARAEA